LDDIFGDCGLPPNTVLKVATACQGLGWNTFRVIQKKETTRWRGAMPDIATDR
jgi:hypothetical protein